MHLMTASLVALAAKLAAGAVADVLPRDSILNQIAWVDQLYTFNNHAKGNLCGDTHDLENHSGDKDAALSVDCLAMLNKINDVKDKAYYSLDSNWPQRADIKTGFAPLITVETCTFSIRPTSFNAVSYAYFVGAQDMSDILHTLINQYSQADHFKANGYMPCTDKYIKMQGDYELEFKIWNPKAQ